MTALREAMRRAGLRSLDERLREIAVRAMAKHQEATFKTAEAIWAEVQKDRELMVHLFQYAWRREVSALMHRVETDLMYDKKHAPLRQPVEKRAAAAVERIPEAERLEEAERKREEAAYQAKQDAEYHEYAASWRRSRIGDIEINGLAVWEQTAGTVRSWLQTQKRKLRVVEMLIEGVPDDGRPISHYRRPEEVETLWAMAAPLSARPPAEAKEPL